MLGIGKIPSSKFPIPGFPTTHKPPTTCTLETMDSGTLVHTTGSSEHVIPKAQGFLSVSLFFRFEAGNA